MFGEGGGGAVKKEQCWEKESARSGGRDREREHSRVGHRPVQSLPLLTRAGWLGVQRRQCPSSRLETRGGVSDHRQALERSPRLFR